MGTCTACVIPEGVGTGALDFAANGSSGSHSTELKNAEVLRALDGKLEHGGERPQDLLELAEAASRSAEFEKAVDLLRAALAAAPADDLELRAKLLHSLGKVLLRLKNATSRNEAIMHLRQAAQMQPNSFPVQLSLSRALRLQGTALQEAEQRAEAKEIGEERALVLRVMQKLRPWHRCSYWLAMELRDLGRHSEVPEILQSYLEAVENVDPEEFADPTYAKHVAMAKHWLSVYRGDSPSAAPALYVEALFDGYADHFEESLLDLLDYKAPELILAELQSVLTKGDVTVSRSLPFCRCADLGCGTGLMAPLLRTLGVVRLEGVDLSEKMLQRAAQKGPAGAGYDRLVCGDLTSIFSSEFSSECGDEFDASTKQPKIRSAREIAMKSPADGADGPERWFDLVVAADVFVYIGDLMPALRSVASRLLPGGLVAFSTEVMLAAHFGDESSFKLEDSGRYSHNAVYVRSVAEAVGLQLRSERQAVLRYDGGAPVTGHVHVFEYPDQTIER